MSQVKSSDHYIKEYYHQNEQNEDRIALHFYAKIIKKLCKQGTIFEYGCGTGHLAKILKDSFHVYAYDISRYAKEKTKKLVPEAVVVNDIYDVPENSCDLVVSLHVLEHIGDPNNSVEYIYSRLKKDGKFLFVVPNVEGLGHEIKKEDWFGIRDTSHVSLFSKKEWENILQKNDFTITKVKGDGMWDVPYFKHVPTIIQKFIFFPPAAAQVLTSSLFLPPRLGECLIFLAKKS